MQKIDRLTQKINSLEEKKYRLERRIVSENTFRKRRTRTLIQLGGLIEKAGLLTALDLAPGDDLQKDPELFDATATLFGALLELKTCLDQNPHQQKHLWQQRGKRGL